MDGNFDLFVEPLPPLYYFSVLYHPTRAVRYSAWCHCLSDAGWCLRSDVTRWTGARYSQKESVVWGSAVWLMAGGTPAGFAGAFVLQYISNIVVKLVLCAVCSPP